jgi:Phage integrase, N-terminal SAM-like domain
MNLVPHTVTPAISSVFATVPALVAAAGERAGMRFLEFFAANIRNPHTRRAYARAADEFLGWCASVGVPSIAAVQPVHVATWIEASTREMAAPSVKQPLAAIRHLFDWLVTGQVVPVNPAGSVRGPRHVVTTGQTPVQCSIRSKRGRCSIASTYLEGVGLRDDPKGPLFRTIGRGTGKLTRTVLPQANAYAMIRRRAAAAGIETKLGNHSFRATGITAYLKNPIDGGSTGRAFSRPCELRFPPSD